MNKKLYIFIITAVLVIVGIMGCDTETKSSKKKTTPGTNSTSSTTPTTVNGDGSDDQIALTDFNISPSGTVNMVVNGTKNFTISYTPENANVIDLTWDVSGDKDVISFDMSAQILVTKTFTVTAVKEGSVTVTVKSLSDSTKSRSVTIVVSNNGGQQGGDPTDDTGDTSDDTGDNSQDIIPVSVTTLNVIINIEDLTIDSLAQVRMDWGTGLYASRKKYDYYKILKKNEVTIEKTSETTGTISFTFESEDLSDGFTPYFFISLIDGNKSVFGNMHEVYQEDAVYDEKTSHSIEVLIDAYYADQGIDIGGT